LLKLYLTLLVGHLVIKVIIEYRYLQGGFIAFDYYSEVYQ